MLLDHHSQSNSLPNFKSIAIAWNTSNLNDKELSVNGMTVFYKTPEHLKLYYSQWKKFRDAAESRNKFETLLSTVKIRIEQTNTTTNIRVQVPERPYIIPNASVTNHHNFSHPLSSGSSGADAVNLTSIPPINSPNSLNVACNQPHQYISNFVFNPMIPQKNANTNYFPNQQQQQQQVTVSPQFFSTPYNYTSVSSPTVREITIN